MAVAVRCMWVTIVTLQLLILSICCNATFPCGFVDNDGSVYSFTNLTWRSTTRPFYADDGIHEFYVNICEGVNEKECREHDGVPHLGFACMYNTSGTVPSFEGVLASMKDNPSPYWQKQAGGVKLSAFNGYYGSIPAKVSIDLRCDPSVVKPAQQIHVNANYKDATFEFSFDTSAACSNGKAAVAIEPSLASRSQASSVAITLTSRPPVDVTIRCESPFLYPAGFFEQTIRGPEDGLPFTWVPMIKLVSNFDANRDSFPLICSLTGSNATLYQYPRSVDIKVETYQPKGHSSLSGGSIFIIILFVVGFFYILFGCLYRWRVVGSEPGMDSFPHIDMWRRIWQYTKDGVSFTLNGCKRTGAYTEVNDTH